MLLWSSIHVDGADPVDVRCAVAIRRMRVHYASVLNIPVEQLERDGIGEHRWTPSSVARLGVLDGRSALTRSRRPHPVLAWLMTPILSAGLAWCMTGDGATSFIFALGSYWGALSLWWITRDGSA